MPRKSGEIPPEGGALVGTKNGGALHHGSPPGGYPGAGRPPAAIREAARLSFAARIPILERIADDEAARKQDRISAIKVLADVGGVDKLALTVEEQPEQKFDAARAAEVMAQVGALQSLRKIEQILTAAASGSDDS